MVRVIARILALWFPFNMHIKSQNALQYTARPLEILRMAKKSPQMGPSKRLKSSMRALNAQETRRSWITLRKHGAAGSSGLP